MARWYEGMKYDGGRAEGPAGGNLFGEVRHEAGNLVHKMYYWAAILEEDAPDPESAAAVGHLRESLAELHGLISRTLDLLRPVKARPILIPVEDLYTSLCSRFGTDPTVAAQALAQIGDRQALVDPLQVDRAAGMLKEAFSLRTGANSNVDSLTLTLQLREESNNSAERIEGAELRCCAKFDTRVEDRDTTAGAVGAALAQRLLEVVGWSIAVDDDPESRTLTIFVPLAASAVARNGSPGTDTSERQTRLNA